MSAVRFVGKGLSLSELCRVISSALVSPATVEHSSEGKVPLSRYPFREETRSGVRLASADLDLVSVTSGTAVGDNAPEICGLDRALSMKNLPTFYQICPREPSFD